MSNADTNPSSVQQLLLENEALRSRVQELEAMLRSGEHAEHLSGSEALRVSEERLQLIQTAARVGVWERNIADQSLYQTPELELLYGVTPGTIRTYSDWTERIHPDDLEMFESERDSAIAQHRTFDIEFRFYHTSGEIRWLQSRGGAVYDERGEATRIVGINIDITGRKILENALRESDERLAIAKSAAQLGIFDYDLIAGTLHWDIRMRQLWGVSSNVTVSHQLFLSGVHPDDQGGVREGVEQACDPAKGGRYSAEYRIVHFISHETHWIEATGHVFFENAVPTRFIGTVQDVTERKRAQHALRESEERLRLALRGAQAGIWDYDPQLDRLLWSEENFALHGRDPAEGNPTMAEWHSYVHPEDLRHAREALLATWEGNRPEYLAEFRVNHRVLGERWLLGMGRLFREKNGKGQRVLGINIDITERKRAEQALAQSEQFQTAVLNSLPAHIAVLDPDGTITAINEGWRRFAFENGGPAVQNAIVGANYFAVCNIADDLVAKNAVEGIRAVISGTVPDYLLEYQCDDPGTPCPRWFLMVVTPAGTRSGGAIVTHLDVTQRKRAEQALRDAKEAAEAASRAKDSFLAALSHELRTPLTPVLLLAGAMEHNLSLPEGIRKDFSTIRRNISIEAQLIDDLLDLTRIARGKLNLEMVHVDAHELVTHSFELVRGTAAQKQINLWLSLHAKFFKIAADPIRVRQIFWNLLANSVKFTPQGGCVEIRSSNTSNGSTSFLCVQIRDTGIGMSPAELERAFDPFSQGDHVSAGRRFGGLGLGLSITQRLVEMHYGRIWAESLGPGRGTTFYVELPLVS